MGFILYIPGRLSFLNQELKIGHLYSALILLVSIFIFKFYKNYYYFYFGILVFVIISLLIGERANFLKSIVYLNNFCFLVFDKKYLLNKLVIFLILALSLTAFITFNKEYNKRFWGQFVKPLIFGHSENLKKENFFEFTVYGANYYRGYKVFSDNKYFGVGIKNYRNESNNFMKIKNLDLMTKLEITSSSSTFRIFSLNWIVWILVS